MCCWQPGELRGCGGGSVSKGDVRRIAMKQCKLPPPSSLFYSRPPKCALLVLQVRTALPPFTVVVACQRSCGLVQHDSKKTQKNKEARSAKGTLGCAKMYLFSSREIMRLLPANATLRKQETSVFYCFFFHEDLLCCDKRALMPQWVTSDHTPSQVFVPSLSASSIRRSMLTLARAKYQNPRRSPERKIESCEKGHSVGNWA